MRLECNRTLRTLHFRNTALSPAELFPRGKHVGIPDGLVNIQCKASLLPSLPLSLHDAEQYSKFKRLRTSLLGMPDDLILSISESRLATTVVPCVHHVFWLSLCSLSSWQKRVQALLPSASFFKGRFQASPPCPHMLVTCQKQGVQVSF